MKKNYFLICVLLACILYSQQYKAGNQQKLVHTVVADTTELRMCIELSEHFLYSNSDSLLHYANKALLISKEIEDRYSEAVALFYLSQACYLKGDYEQTLGYSYRTIELSNATNNYEYHCLALNIIGYIYRDWGDYDEALENYNKSLYIFKQNNDDRHLSTVLCNIGFIYKSKGDFSKAIEYYQQSLELARELDKKKDIAVVLNNIGNIYFEWEKYSDALEYYQETIEIRRLIDDMHGIANSYNNIGTVYQNTGDFSKALDYYSKALDIVEELGFKRGESYVLHNLAELYYESDDIDKTLLYHQKALEINREIEDVYGIVVTLKQLSVLFAKQKKYDLALENLDEACLLATEAQLNNSLQLIYNQYSTIYNSMGDIRKAFDYYKTSISFKDSVFNIESKKQLSNFQVKYDVRKKDQEIQIKNKENEVLLNEKKFSNLKIYFLLISLCMLFIITLLIINKQKTRIRKEKELAEKNMLLHLSQKKVMELEKQNLKKELDYKNNDLTNFGLYIVQKNEFLEQLKRDLQESNLQENKKFINSINQHINIEKEIKEFQIHIEQLNEAFFFKLAQKFPGLTENEKNLCAFLKLNLTSKDIAILSNITSKSVDMGRYRLRKKLNIDPDIKISEFLNNL